MTKLNAPQVYLKVLETFYTRGSLLNVSHDKWALETRGGTVRRARPRSFGYVFARGEKEMPLSQSCLSLELASISSEVW